MHEADRSSNTGTLFIVATPIGNLADFSSRGVQILSEVDLILVEDSRHSRILLDHFGVQTKTTSLHEHNERSVASSVISKLRQGLNIALISDAGTPLINDPGFVLVRLCRESGIQVSPVPGACALVAALSVSGLPTDRFRFEGFLPRTESARITQLKALEKETASLVFYESAHRIEDSLTDLVKVFGGSRQAFLARELTKRYEELLFLPLAELQRSVASDAHKKRGEFVLIVAGTEKQEQEFAANEIHMLKILADALPTKQAAEIAARLTGHSKNKVYAYLLELGKKQK